jgi:hypothetical protein
VKPVIAVTRPLPFFPPVYRVRHQEVEPPYRASPGAVVVRIPLRYALVFALMRRTGFTSREQALAALGFRAHERIVANRREVLDARGPGGLLHDGEGE